MVLLKWHDKYATGVRLIDEQHRSLFQAVNDLHEAMVSGQGKETIRQTLSFLVRYTETHFKDEERIMAEHGFPGLARHKVEHAELLKTAHGLEAKLSDKAFALPIEVSTFLSDWIKHHINEADFGFINYLRSKPDTAGAGRS